MKRSDPVTIAEERGAVVDAVLERFFSLAKKRAEPLGEHYQHLWGLLERNTQGGKRFRPRMVMAAYSGLGGTDPRTMRSARQRARSRQGTMRSARHRARSHRSKKRRAVRHARTRATSHRTCCPSAQWMVKA